MSGTVAGGQGTIYRCQHVRIRSSSDWGSIGLVMMPRPGRAIPALLRVGGVAAHEKGRYAGGLRADRVERLAAVLCAA